MKIKEKKGEFLFILTTFLEAFLNLGSVCKIKEMVIILKNDYT